jgi:hypothetical protein
MREVVGLFEHGGDGCSDASADDGQQGDSGELSHVPSLLVSMFHSPSIRSTTHQAWG